MAAHGGFGTLELAGDFLGGEILDVAEDECDAFAFGKGGEAGFEARLAFGAEDDDLGVFFFGGGQGEHFLDIAEADAVMAAEEIDGGIGGDAREPVGGFFGIAELFLALKHLDKDFLGEILGVVDVADDAVDEQEHAPHVAGDELVAQFLLPGESGSGFRVRRIHTGYRDSGWHDTSTNNDGRGKENVQPNLILLGNIFSMIGRTGGEQEWLRRRQSGANMLQITWLGHSSFALRSGGGETLLIDPWFDNPKFPKDFALDRVDGILVTHGHFDHIASVRALAAQYSPAVVGIYEVAGWLESKGVKNTIGMNKGGTVQVGSFSATMTHAMHSSSIADDDGRTVYAGEAAGYVIGTGDGRRAYFAGDTTVFGDMKLIGELYEPELAFLPIGDLYTMGPREAAAACRMLGVKKVIPMHWGTFPPLTGRPEQLAELIRDLPGTTVWPLEPGVPVTW